MNLQNCRNINSEEACAHLTTNVICFFYFSFLFYRKRWQPGCVTKNYTLKTNKVQFPSYSKVQEYDSSHGLSLFVNPWKQEVLLTLNMLLGTSSEQHGLLRKRRIISALAPLSEKRTSSVTDNGRQCPCC